MQNQLETKKHFVRYISHQIRTPLNTVVLGIQLLSDKINGLDPNAIGSDLKDIVRDIGYSSKASIEILNDLLLFDKIEEGNLILNCQYCCVKECMLEWIRPFDIQVCGCDKFNQLITVKFQAAQAKIELQYSDELNIPDDVGNKIIHVDCFKLAQVFRNLLSNAFKFTKSGGVIRVSAEILSSQRSHDIGEGIRDKCVRFVIKDSGCGISSVTIAVNDRCVC